MNFRTLALVLGSALTVAVGGVSATACSSSTAQTAGGDHDAGGKTDGTTSSSGGSSGGEGGGGEGGGGEGGSHEGGSSGGGDAGLDCGATPLLHRNDAGSILCAYAEAGALDCPVGEECCLGGSIAGQPAATGCAAFGAVCTNGSAGDGGTDQPAIPIECAQISDCTANGLATATACCLKSATKDSVACAFPTYSGGTAIVCEGDAGAGGKDAGACAPGETQICSSPADCPVGKTCVAGRWKLLQMGFCQ